HIVATLGSDGMKLYIDGNQVAANPGVTKAQVYRGYWRVGGDRLTSWPSSPSREAIAADIDEVAVYPSALSLSQVSAHYAASGRGSGLPDIPPQASFTPSVTYHTASFTSTSTDADGTIASYAWDFGDGTTGTGATPSHTYATAGTYTVTLTVTDDRGVTGTATGNVTISDGYASDTFERVVSNGWGTADVGGAWTSSGTASAFSTGSGAGHIVGALSASRAAYLTGVRQTDVDVSSDVALDRTASGGGAYVSIIGRRVSQGNDYRLKLRYQPDGSVIAYLARTVGGAETILANITVPGLHVNPGDVLRARFALSGTSTTTLQAKVWSKTSQEPSAWLVGTTDATPPALQSAGDIGVLVYVSGSWIGTAPVVTIDNLAVIAPTG
ncbi:MAG TPA: PKD domain-containing protein, partial [Acidimicrobiia bacterium]|nr:PKD domain-containing protein [Acidimicrobiia bacterium]